MMQKLAQCYKVLINDTCTFEDVWYGRNAKIFEGCELSQDGSDKLELEFYTYEWEEKREDRTWIGTSEPYSDTYCKPLPLIGSTTAGASLNTNMRTWAKSVYGVATSWISARSGKEGRIASASKTLTGNPKDYIPHYQLPW